MTYKLTSIEQATATTITVNEHEISTCTRFEVRFLQKVRIMRPGAAAARYTAFGNELKQTRGTIEINSEATQRHNCTGNSTRVTVYGQLKYSFCAARE